MIREHLPMRKKLRLEGYDYSSGGAYFVTICTNNRKHIFWDVGANCVRPHEPIPLSPIGRLIDDEIQKLNSVYENVFVDKYCIMPDHIHMILMIETDESRRTQFAPTISRVIKQFKGAISKQVGYSFWQKGFVDRIIRDDKMYQGIWKYIDENPLHSEDEE